MIVLDTNAISELSRKRPDPAVVDWFARQRRDELFLCAPVLAELVFGAEKYQLRTGDRRHYMALGNLRNDYFTGPPLMFDERAAEIFGIQRARRERAGLPVLEFDLMIAAICLVHGATLATRNARDFDGLDLKLVNPFEKAA